MDETEKPYKYVTSGFRHVMAQAVLLACSGLCLFLMSGPQLRNRLLSGGDRILLADFSDETGDSFPPGGLRQLLTLVLNQSRHVQLVSESWIRQASGQAPRPEGEGINREMAFRLCQRNGIPGFILPSIRWSGESYLMRADWIDVREGRTSEVPLDSVRVAGRPELLYELDRLGRRIRLALGEGRDSLDMTGKVLPPAVTRNAEALELFVRALALEANANYDGEAALLQQTIALNHDFILADVKLAQVLARLGQTRAALDAAERVEMNSRALPLRERLRAEAFRHILNQEYAEARKTYREFASIYPGDPKIQYDLGELLLLQYEYGSAVECFTRSIRLDDSQTGSYLGLAAALLFRRDYVSARRAWQKAQELEPEDTRAICTGGLIDLVDNDVGSALRFFHKLSVDPFATTQSLGTLLTSQALIYGGRFDAALAALDDGIAADIKRGDTCAVMPKRLAKAETYLLLDDAGKALVECNGYEPESNRIEDIGRVGAVYARAGRIAEARAFLGHLDSGPKTPARIYQAAILQGEIELAAGNPQAAVAALQRAKQMYSAAPPLEPLARALVKMRLLSQAEAEYRNIFGQKAAMLFSAEGPRFMGTWPDALFELAVCLENLGKGDEALQYYRSYLWTLDGADPGIPKIRQARERLKKRPPRHAAF